MTTTSASTWPEVLNQLTDRAAKEGLLDRLKAVKTISDKVKIVRDAPGIRLVKQNYQRDALNDMLQFSDED